MHSSISEVDEEWVNLIKSARNMGLTVEEIKEFLKKNNPDKKQHERIENGPVFR